MMRVLTLCCTFTLAVALSMSLTVADAQAAKRFGSGGSFGKLFATPKKAPTAPKQSPDSGQTASKTATPAAGAAKPKSAMGGMLGGLLAGGLLAALFMGGAFEGIQMMDILILAAIAFAAFYFIKRMTQPQQKPQYAGYQPPRDEPQSEDAGAQAFTATGAAMGSDHLAEAELDLPSWFNKEAFLEGGREHFIKLQQAWAENDLESIRSYCHPGFFQIIEEERAALGAEVLDNEVVSVMAEIIGFNERNGNAELSINFYGWMREGAEQETEFNEVWHLTRDLKTEDADWFIVGIEQP